MSTTINDNQWLIDLFASAPSDEEVALLERAEAAAKAVKVALEKARTCPRCSGTGRISHYSHIKGGECFGCSGTGVKNAA